MTNSCCCMAETNTNIYIYTHIYIYIHIHTRERVSHSVVSNSLWPRVAHQAPLSMVVSRQEYWSGLPFPSPGDLPNPGIKPGSPALQADSLPSEPPDMSLPSRASLHSPHPTHLGHHRAPGWAPCIIYQFPTILHMIVCICWCYFLNSSLLSSLPSPAVSTSPFCTRFISTTFLDSLYIC